MYAIQEENQFNAQWYKHRKNVLRCTYHKVFHIISDFKLTWKPIDNSSDILNNLRFDFDQTFQIGKCISIERKFRAVRTVHRSLNERIHLAWIWWFHFYQQRKQPPLSISTYLFPEYYGVLRPSQCHIDSSENFISQWNWCDKEKFIKMRILLRERFESLLLLHFVVLRKPDWVARWIVLAVSVSPKRLVKCSNYPVFCCLPHLLIYF